MIHVHAQDHLTRMRSLLQVPKCADALLERKGPVNDRMQLVRFKKLEHPGKLPWRAHEASMNIDLLVV